MIPPVTPKNILRVATAVAVLYLLALLLFSLFGRVHSAERYNCADHGYIACCFSGGD